MDEHEIKALFSLLGLDVFVKRLDHSKLLPNTSFEETAFETPDEVMKAFQSKKLSLSLNFFMNFSGFSKLLKNKTDRGTLQPCLLSSEEYFILNLLINILPSKHAEEIGKFLISARGEDKKELTLQDRNFYRDLMRSRTRIDYLYQLTTEAIPLPKNIAQYTDGLTLACSEDFLNELHVALAPTLETKQRLETIFKSLGFNVTAHPQIEGILQDNGCFDDKFCLQFQTQLSDAKYIANIKMLLAALGINDYEEIPNRMGKPGYTIALDRQNYQKIALLSLDLLASLDEIVTETIQARQKGNEIEAEIGHQALCHLLKAHTAGSENRGLYELVPQLAADVTAQVVDYKTKKPLDESEIVYTALPTMQLSHYLRDWQTSLDGMFLAEMMLKKKADLWVQITSFFSQSPLKKPSVSQGSDREMAEILFELSALEPDGLVGRCLHHNRQVLKNFINLSLTTNQGANLPSLEGYFNEWKATLIKMMQMEMRLAEKLYNYSSALTQENPTKPLYEQIISELHASIDGFAATIKAMSWDSQHSLPPSDDVKRELEQRIKTFCEHETPTRGTLVTWEQFQAIQEKRPLVQVKSRDELQSVRDAFKQMGLGDVVIKEVIDGYANKSYSVTLKQGSRFSSEPLSSFLIQQGMSETHFDVGIFASTIGTPGARQHINMKDNVFTCNPQHLHQFMDHFNHYQTNKHRLNSILQLALVSTNDAQILAPWDTFTQAIKHGLHSIDHDINFKGCAIAFKNEADALRIQSLTRALTGVECAPILKNGILFFSEDALKLINERGSVLQFFKPINEQRVAAQKKNNKTVEFLLSQFMERLIGKIYAQHEAGVITHAIGQQTIQLFNSDQSTTGSMTAELKSWLTENAHLNDIQVIRPFLEDFTSLEVNESLYTTLFRRYYLPNSQQIQEQAVQKLFDSYLTRTIDSDAFQISLPEFIASQKKLNDCLVFHLQSQYAGLVEDSILRDQLQLTWERSNSLLIMLHAVQNLLANKPDTIEQLQENIASFNELMTKPDFIALRDSISSFDEMIKSYEQEMRETIEVECYKEQTIAPVTTIRVSQSPAGFFSASRSAITNSEPKTTPSTDTLPQ